MDELEVKYASLFPSDTGNVAKPLCMALGSLIIQSRFQFPDRELVEQIMENPYLQYFIGLPGYQDTPPFDASTRVLFRKRITADMLNEANRYLLAHKNDDSSRPPSSRNGTEEGSMPKEDGSNKGTLAIDATCAPANIRYPQDISLLNEAREKLEQMISHMCRSYGLQPPRRYRRKVRKEYLAFAKCRKHNKKQVRTTVRKQLSYVRRDLGYPEGYFSQGCVPDTRDIPDILTIFKLYEQQESMYRNKVHSVSDRIVSISQPWIRPIVRGKAKAPVEFGQSWMSVLTGKDTADWRKYPLAPTMEAAV